MYHNWDYYYYSKLFQICCKWIYVFAVIKKSSIMSNIIKFVPWNYIICVALIGLQNKSRIWVWNYKKKNIFTDKIRLNNLSQKKVNHKRFLLINKHFIYVFFVYIETTLDNDLLFKLIKEGRPNDAKHIYSILCLIIFFKLQVSSMDHNN